MSRQQVKAVYTDNTFIRGLEELSAELSSAEAKPARIIIDLANTKFDVLAALQLIKEAGFQEQTVCFYPHVHVELAQSAVALGFQQIQIRSKFFGNLQEAFQAVN